MNVLSECEGEIKVVPRGAGRQAFDRQGAGSAERKPPGRALPGASNNRAC